MQISLIGDMETLGMTTDEDRLSFRMCKQMIDACVEVNKGKTVFRVSQSTLESIGNRFETHPDAAIVRAFIDEQKADDGSIGVIYYLCAHVLTEWGQLPKRTIKEHRIFNEIEETALRLADLIDKTDAPYYRGGGHGLQGALVSRMLIPSEEDVLLGRNYVSYVHEDGSTQESDIALAFPSIEQVLNRLAQAARRLADAGPIHSQPNKRGARTGYFVRRIGELIEQRYGAAPPVVLAALGSITLNEVIDEDLARKHMSLSERSSPK